MNEEAISIHEIWQRDSKTLAIKWSDGDQSDYNVFDLRANCPCAMCVDEMSMKRTLDPNTLDPGVKPVTIDSVGLFHF